jgi:hypothetical protein
MSHSKLQLQKMHFHRVQCTTGRVDNPNNVCTLHTYIYIYNHAVTHTQSYRRPRLAVVGIYHSREYIFSRHVPYACVVVYKIQWVLFFC